MAIYGDNDYQGKGNHNYKVSESFALMFRVRGKVDEFVSEGLWCSSENIDRVEKMSHWFSVKANPAK